MDFDLKYVSPAFLRALLWVGRGRCSLPSGCFQWLHHLFMVERAVCGMENLSVFESLGEGGSRRKRHWVGQQSVDWTHVEKQQGQVRGLSINARCGRSQSAGQFRDEAREMVLLGQRALSCSQHPTHSRVRTRRVRYVEVAVVQVLSR